MILSTLACFLQSFTCVHFQDHKPIFSLPPLPEAGEVPEWTIVSEDSRESSLPEVEAADSDHLYSGSSNRSSGSSLTPSAAAVSPAKNKRKRLDDEDEEVSSKT